MSHIKITRADGTERQLSGYHYAKPDAQAKPFASQLGKKKLPAKVDLRPYMTEVEDQENTSSCVANAVAGAYEYLAKRHLGEDSYNVSRLFIYYNARSYRSWEEKDSGSFISDAIEGLREYGACSEETWVFDVKAVTSEPDEESYNEAAQFLVESVELVPVDLTAWKSALAEGHPIIFGISLFKSFDSQRKKGLVPMPSPQETARASHGGHAMLCVGYSDNDQMFIVRNSWGADWGDNGYCYIPYRYLVNPEFNSGDCWIIKQLDNFEIDEESWSDDDESVLGDWETEFAEMSDEDYQEMLEAMGDYPLELRLAMIIMSAAGADDDVSDEEIDEITTYMDTLLELLGVKMKTARLLRNALKQLDDEELLEESIDLLGEYLSGELLARIIQDIETLIGVDDMSEEEEEFLNELISRWQIEDNEEESEDDDEDYEEDEDEEEEEEEEEEPTPKKRR
ncbi:C1 family peptidase [Beggiatoa leptomitoformis]|uniref:Peptidase C1 n=1 Tax=Beggiatoa leptomitoformis TaxID=288004 RepID=A0A2N9YB26_9GAMM|nr:C1 family peptidase [Beggiatoa leptomitoformis]AUI67675.1 peptidase C1 [Beggiatoa leptomitoformis]QGX03522.1 peptidase C1 [Beggiatoa leptomitoformis]